MARVPSAADVQRAPSPPLVGRQIASSINADTFGGSAFAAGANAFDAVQSIALQEREKRFASENQAALNEIAAKLPISYDKILEESKNTAPEGGKGFYDSTQQKLAAERDRVMQDIKSRYDLQDTDFKNLSAKAQLLATPTMSAALRFQSDERKRFFTDQLNTQVQSIALDAARDPSATSVRLAQVETVIKNAEGFLSPGEAAKLRNTATSIISKSAIEGRIEQDPGGMFRDLTAGKFDKLVKEGHLTAGDILNLTNKAFSRTREMMQLSNSMADRADRLARRRLDDLSAETHKQAIDLEHDGKLTYDWIFQHRSDFNETDYQATNKLLKGQDTATDDPATLVDLNGKIGKGDASKEINQAYTNHLITKESFTQLTTANRTFLKADQPATPYKSARDFVRDSLDQGSLMIGPSRQIAAQAQSNGLREFDTWATAHPDASRQDSMAEADRIVKGYSVIQLNQISQTLGLPRFYKGSRAQLSGGDAGGLDDAERQAWAAYDAGQMSKDQLLEEVTKIKNWRAAISRQGAARPSGGGSSDGFNPAKPGSGQ